MAKDVLYQKKKNDTCVAGTAKGTKILRTNLSGGGACDWVPEDEAQRLITKFIDKDGTYEARNEPAAAGDPPWYGYSEVTVQGIGEQVMGELGTITISKNGTYYAKTAYSASDLGNGTGSSTADNEKKYGPFYGYRKVIVNVTKNSDSSGSSSSSSSSSKKNATYGKDANGDSVKYTTDSNGNLKKSYLATSIQISALPKFTTYRNGDTIDYSGLKVRAFAKGEVYKDDDYPNGTVPFSELILTVETASGSGGESVSIPVKWKRAGDDKELSTSFDITVNNAN